MRSNGSTPHNRPNNQTVSPNDFSTANNLNGHPILQSYRNLRDDFSSPSSNLAFSSIAASATASTISSQHTYRQQNYPHTSDLFTPVSRNHPQHQQYQQTQHPQQPQNPQAYSLSANGAAFQRASHNNRRDNNGNVPPESFSPPHMVSSPNLSTNPDLTTKLRHKVTPATRSSFNTIYEKGNRDGVNERKHSYPSHSSFLPIFPESGGLLRQEVETQIHEHFGIFENDDIEIETPLANKSKKRRNPNYSSFGGPTSSGEPICFPTQKRGRCSTLATPTSHSPLLFDVFACRRFVIQLLSINQITMAQWYSTHCLIVSQANPVDVYLSALTAYRSGNFEECERILRTYPIVAPSSPFQLHETMVSIDFYRQREQERVKQGGDYSSEVPGFSSLPQSATNGTERPQAPLAIEIFPLDQEQMLLPTDPRDLFYGVFLLLQCLLSQKKWKEALEVLGETSETSLEAVLQNVQELLARSESMETDASSEIETISETGVPFASKSYKSPPDTHDSKRDVYDELTTRQSITTLCNDAAFLSSFHFDFFPLKMRTSANISGGLLDTSISLFSLLSLYRAQIYRALEQPPPAAFWAKKAFELDYRNVEAFQLLCSNHYESNEKLIAMVYEQDPAPQFSWLLPLYLSLIPSLNLMPLNIEDEDGKNQSEDEAENENENENENEMVEGDMMKNSMEAEEYGENDEFTQGSGQEENNFASLEANMGRKKERKAKDLAKSNFIERIDLRSETHDIQIDTQMRQGGIQKRQTSLITSQTMLSRILATVNQVQIVGTVILPCSRYSNSQNQNRNQKKHSQIFRYGVFFDLSSCASSPVTFASIRHTTTGSSLQFSPSIITSLASYLYHTSNYISCSRLCRLVFLSPVAYLYISNSDVIQYYACSLVLLSSSTAPLSSSSLPPSSISFKSSYAFDSTGIGIGVGLGSESTSPSAELHSLARTLVQRDPQNPTSWYVAALSQFSTGSVSVVRKLLLKAVTLQPSFSPAWLLFGHTFARQGESSQALSAYRMAVAAAPYAAAPLLSQAQELVATSSSVSSSMNSTSSLTFELTLYPVLNILENAMLLSRNDPFVLHEKGIVLYSLQRFHEASLVFQSILELGSRKCVKKGEITGSSTNDLTHGSQNSQNFAILDTILSSLGHTYRKMKKYEDAAHIFERALIIAPSKTSLHVSLGFTYHLMGSINEAIDQYQVALNANPQDSFVAALMQRAIAFTVTYTEIDELIPKRRRHGHIV